MSITTKMSLNWYSSMKKNWKDSDDFWHRKLTLKVRNQDFLIATCQTYVDLPKNFFSWKSAIFHSIKLPFDAKVAEKNLKYYLLSNQLKVGKLLPKKQPIFFLNFHLLIILIKNSCRIHKKVWYIWQNLWIFLIIYLKFVLFFLYFPPI